MWFRYDAPRVTALPQSPPANLTAHTRLGPMPVSQGRCQHVRRGLFSVSPPRGRTSASIRPSTRCCPGHATWIRLDQLRPYFDAHFPPGWTDAVRALSDLLHKGDAIN